FFVDEHFLDKGPIRFEDLDAIINTIADIELVIIRELGTMYGIAELLRRRIVGIVAAHICVIGLVAVGAPVALVLAGVGIENNNSMVAVAVRDISFISLGVDEDLGWQAQIFDVIAALAALGLADLHQEFAVLRELQNHVVGKALEAGSRSASAGCCGLIVGTVDGAARALRPAAVAADPYVAFVVNRDPMI